MYPPQAVALFAVSTIFPFFSVVAVVLRVYARRLTNSKLEWSDYWIFFTLLNAILNAIACIIGAAACGIGLPLDDLTPWIEVRFLKILFVTQFFYIFSVFSVKISVLLFYKSIFKTSPAFTRIVNYTLVFLGAWIIAFFFVTLFQDNPIQRNWGTVGTTINWRVFYIVEIASDVFLDIFILCLPALQISRLHMSTRKKWLLTSVFGLGGFIVIASTVRLAYMVIVLEQFQVEDDDFSFTTVNTIIWGSIEPCTSVVAACLPVMSPVLFRKQRAAKAARQNAISSFFRSNRWTRSKSASKQKKGPPRRGRYDSLLDTGLTTTAAAAAEDGSQTSTKDGELELPNRVMVKHEIHVDFSSPNEA